MPRLLAVNILSYNTNLQPASTLYCDTCGSNILTTSDPFVFRLTFFLTDSYSAVAHYRERFAHLGCKERAFEDVRSDSVLVRHAVILHPNHPRTSELPPRIQPTEETSTLNCPDCRELTQCLSLPIEIYSVGYVYYCVGCHYLYRSHTSNPTRLIYMTSEEFACPECEEYSVLTRELPLNLYCEESGCNWEINLNSYTTYRRD